MILRESVDLVIDGADFYRGIEAASITKLRNGWCDFTRLALQQAKESLEHPAVGRIWYFDPRPRGSKEESYGSNRRRDIWLGRLKRLNVSDFLASARRGYHNRADDPDYVRKAKQEAMAGLIRQTFSPNVLVLATTSSLLIPYIDELQECMGFAKGILLPPDGSESKGITHDHLEEVQLCGRENDELWFKYMALKQDSLLVEKLWSTWRAETHDAVQKRMRLFSETHYSKRHDTFLSRLEQDPAREQNFLTRAKPDLEPFIDAIRKDNRRLANEVECARFCLHMAVREVAAAERSRLLPPAQHARVYRWAVNFHEGCRRDTEKWPRNVRDELDEKCDLLRERGPGLVAPLVKTLEGNSTVTLKRLRLQAAGGAYRIVFTHVEQGEFIVLAGGKKGGSDDHRFYQLMIETATNRIRARSERAG